MVVSGPEGSSTAEARFTSGMPPLPAAAGAQLRAAGGEQGGARGVPETQPSTTLLNRWCVDQAHGITWEPAETQAHAPRPTPNTGRLNQTPRGAAQRPGSQQVVLMPAHDGPAPIRLWTEVETVTGLKAQESA